MSTIFNRDDDAAPQTAARGAPRATLGMRLYDDLPEAKTAAKGDAEGGGDEGRGGAAPGRLAASAIERRASATRARERVGAEGRRRNRLRRRLGCFERRRPR